NDHIKSF
ncbi:unnamed protein product, partial [Allacma fusca]